MDYHGPKDLEFATLDDKSFRLGHFNKILPRLLLKASYWIKWASKRPNSKNVKNNQVSIDGEFQIGKKDKNRIKLNLKWVNFEKNKMAEN